jgi:hypothetical protein
VVYTPFLHQLDHLADVALSAALLLDLVGGGAEVAGVGVVGTLAVLDE